MNVRPFVLAVIGMVCAVAPVFGDTPATLRWDASPEAGVAGYVVYVGRQAGSYDEAFDVQQQTSFVYANAVPGRPYFFSVAAYTLSREMGPRSEEVLFLGGSALTVPFRAEGADAGDLPSRAASTRSTASNEMRSGCFGGACYAIETIAEIEGVSGLSRTIDGRVLFIENGQHVRVIEGDRLVGAAALSAERGSTLAALALDPAFGDTGFVFVGIISGGADGDRQMDVVRYREVANILGEPAVVIAGLPLPAIGDASLTVDAARRLYVAMPAASGAAHAERYAGMVLRFEHDGTAVHGDGADAPVLSPGYAQPTSLSWIGARNELWLAGAGEGDAARITRIPLSSRALSDADASLMLVDDAGGVFHLAVTANGFSTNPWIAPDALGGAVTSAVSDASESDVYLAIRDGNEPVDASRIVRLRRQ